MDRKLITKISGDTTEGDKCPCRIIFPSIPFSPNWALLFRSHDMPNLGRKVQIITLHTVSIEIDEFVHSIKISFSQNFNHPAACNSF
jgi:hypothetical protein